MVQPTLIAGVDVFVEGTGPETIIMIHGWPDTHRIWQAQVDFFKLHYRCVYFTLPGFDAAKPAKAYALRDLTAIFLQIIDQISPDQPVTLMLHDWGCFFGYQFYMQHPARVARIIGIDIGDADSPAFLNALTPTAKAMIVGYQVPLATAWKIGGRMGDRMARGVARVLQAKAAPERINAAMGYPYYIRWAGAFGSYKQAIPFQPACPIFYAYGKKKPFMFHSTSWITALAQQPQNKVVAFSCPHWVMVDAAEAFNTAVYDWLTHV